MIDGKLVRIRTVKEADVDELYSLSCDYQDAGEYMPLSLVSESAFKAEHRQTGFWQDHCGKLLVEDLSGRMVGEAGFFKTAHYLDGREVYYRIFSGYRGQGYASDTLALLVQLFFESTSFNRLQAVTIEGNQASEHILKKSGFVLEGTVRQARYFKGRIVDLNLFSLLRGEYQES
ncbi:GNAT family protein [Aliiglaciecola sp. CAU 1673]|uniref:GNAT family N-acetyltransferase n=1 Tax=Aliiglaciecola sp. CAU 1673 TaxID=3032595 RepID=UPI0023D9A91E|nr:GNAT family protein [Aliiglaciecola sp. CAU 1673]MDF2180284.1 GNAT family protein [Aliiglaciecola sp. CAU 1673]